MIILGARGHAIEVLEVLDNIQERELCFYDDVNTNAPALLFNRYPILRSESEALEHLRLDTRIVIGIGNGRLRERLAARAVAWGGTLHTVIAANARIGRYEVALGAGLNIMDGVLISSETTIGEGSLINARAALHHNVSVGRYCEVSPGAQLLGHVQLGDYSQVGAGAIILPHVTIGKGATIGAGAVVTRNVSDSEVVVGVPARALHKK